MSASIPTNVKFQKQVGGPNIRYGYASCKKCMKPTLILDFGKRESFCTQCHFKGQIPDSVVENHLKNHKRTHI